MEKKEIITCILTIVAVAFGWFLGEGTAFLKQFFRNRNLKNALLGELRDSLSYLNGAKLNLENMIQLSSLNAIPVSVPSNAPTYIYTSHYPEICIFLSEDERKSFHGIYDKINLIHIQYKNISELSSLCISDSSKRRILNSYIEGAYYNVCNAIEIIGYHLKHSKKFNFAEIEKISDKERSTIINKRILSLVEEAKNNPEKILGEK